MSDRKPPRRPFTPRDSASGSDSGAARGASPWSSARPRTSPGDASPRQAPSDEQRLYGLNACLAAFAARPGALRKLWLRDDRIPRLKAVLAWCVQQRIGYRVVSDADLDKLSGSAHHEGVVMAVTRRADLPLDEWLQSLPAGACLALWLAGVGNPHNLGAILRSAAHFGVAGLLLEADDALALSGAACRVAEGGADVVPLVRLPTAPAAMRRLQAAGFELAATTVRAGESLFEAALPKRLVLVLGAEGEGLSEAQAAQFGRRLCIPGSGAVESLNVSAASAVFLAEWTRRHGRPK